MTRALDYDRLVRDFENSLVTTLRGHRAGEDYLDMWVPDEDPVKGILNMVEAAQAAGRRGIEISVLLTTLPASRHQELRRLVARLGSVELASATDRVTIAVELIRQ
jgi:hypothetical protein